MGKNNKFQFPGGKPEDNETIIQTISRELYEEAGIELDSFTNEPKQFGYYLIKDDPNWSDLPEYLQIRYFLFADKLSDDINLSVNERAEDIDKIHEAKFVDLYSLPQFIPWTKVLIEYEELIKLRD